MYVKLSNDKTYPIIITNSWGEVVNIHRSILENSDEWNEFIDNLNGWREFYLKYATEIYKK